MNSTKTVLSENGAKKYVNLFKPGKIGKLEVKNRIVMPAMGTNMSDSGVVNTAVINHYARRAAGGAGLIIVEVTCVDSPLGLNTPDMLRIDEDAHIKGHRKITDAVHNHDAKVFLQLSHTGRGAKADVIGGQPVGPSEVTMPFSFMMGLEGEKPRALTLSEIETIEDKYADAARRAKEAGYDGVEIHSTGYYLGQQFLSKQANTRTDEYGGTKQKRARFLENVIRKSKDACGTDYPVIIKLSVMELGKMGGISLLDGMYYSYASERAGADAIEVLAGAWNETAGKKDKPETGQAKGLTFPLCSLMKMTRVAGNGLVNFLFGKKALSIPIIGGGRTFEPELAEKALASKRCDFVYMGRGMLAEPDLPSLILNDEFELARPCIGCNQCVNEQLQFRRRIGCAGCPVMGLEDNDYTLQHAVDTKKVIVVGGGPAGCEAAITAAKRGHIVTLVERENTIGGQINLAVLPLYKQNIVPLIDFYRNRLIHHGVTVRLNEEATKETLENMHPDVVIFATGSKPGSSGIKGADNSVVKCYKDVLKNKNTGKRVVIVGGGTVGSELALMLAQQKKIVTIIEMSDDIAAKMAKTAQSILKGHLQQTGVTIHLLSNVTEIKNDEVLFENNGKQMSVNADTVILCTGDEKENSLYNECKDSFGETYNVGDSNSIADIRLAVRDGYLAGIKVGCATW